MSRSGEKASVATPYSGPGRNRLLCSGVATHVTTRVLVSHNY